MLRPSYPISLNERDRSVDMEGFLVTETVRGPSLTLPRHFHEHTNIGFVVKGSFIETIGNRPHECQPCSLIVRPAGESHLNQYGNVEARCLIIEVKLQRLERFRELSDALESAYHLRDELLSALALRISKELRRMDGSSPLAIEALILEILVRLSRRGIANSSIEPRWLCEARDLIHENFSAAISLSNVAETVGVHPAHLARTFRRYYLCTVGDYVRKLRLEKASRDLTCGERSLADIALTAGFYDQSHFSHAFKLYLGMTPAEFRAATHRRKPNTKKLLRSKTQ